MELFQTIYAYASAHWADILAIYGAVVACATVIVKITPTQADDAILGKVIDIVAFFSHVETKKPVDPNAPTVAIAK